MELSHSGYDNVDGLDHSVDALNVCRTNRAYRNYILGRVAELVRGNGRKSIFRYGPFPLSKKLCRALSP